MNERAVPTEWWKWAGRPRVGRRMFLADLGRGAVAVAVFGVAAACSDSDDESASESAPPSTSPTSPSGPPTSSPGVALQRVDLGFVSAYVLARGSEATVVDTGVEGSAPKIEEALAAAGLAWDAVGHVILTHHHPDHAGSLAAVAERAARATLYAGAADIGMLTSPREVRPLGDGDEVFGLEIVATPGHTPGHICVLDPVGSLIIVGDAMANTDGKLTGSSPQFTADPAMASESVKKLATLTFDKVAFGHGPPIESGAGAAVKTLADSL